MYWLTYLLHFNRNSNLQVSRLQSLLIQDPVLSRNWGWIVRQGSWSLHLLAGLGNFLVEIWKYLYLANWNIYFRGEICKGSLVSLGMKCCEFEGQSPWPYKLKKRNFKSCIRGPLESLLTRCHGVPETTGFCFSVPLEDFVGPSVFKWKPLPCWLLLSEHTVGRWSSREMDFR